MMNEWSAIAYIVANICGHVLKSTKSHANHVWYLYFIKSEFDENESNTAPPELPKTDDKESKLDLPEDLKLDDTEPEADDNDAENTPADDIAGDKFYLYCILIE